MMTDTTTTHESGAGSALATWPSVESDRYLDARQPAWAAHERGGRVRYARLLGERRSRVYVDPAATEILDILLAAPPAARSDTDTPVGGAVRAEAERG